MRDLESDAISFLSQHHESPPFQLDLSGKKSRLGKRNEKGSPAYWANLTRFADGGESLTITFSTFRHGGYKETQTFYNKPANKSHIATLSRATPSLLATKTAQLATKKQRYKQAQTLYSQAQNQGTSSYLERKQVAQYADAVDGLRYGQGHFFLDIKNINGDLQGFQRIDNKSKLIYGKLSGNFALIGDFPTNTKAHVYLCEGLATGLSVYGAMGGCVVVAFSANNLPKVAANLKYLANRNNQDLQINIAADNDCRDKYGNPRPDLNAGLESAHKTALRVKGCHIYAPNNLRTGSDFNDLHIEQGLDAVRDALKPENKIGLNNKLAFAHELRQQDKRQGKNKNALSCRYLPDDLQINEGINFVKSAKGTGKTHSLKEILKGSESAIYISHLISLANDASERLNLDFYIDTKKSGIHLANYKHLSICVNSLYKLSDGANIPNYQYVVIDEIEQLLRRLCTSIQHKQIIFESLKYLLRSAKHVILLDADLGQLTKEFIADIAPDRPTHWITNYYKPAQDNLLKIYPSQGQLLDKAIEALQDNKRVFITANSKREARKIYKALDSLNGNKQGLYVSGDNTGDNDVLAFFADVNKQAKLYQFIVTTPAANTGISIDSINGAAAFDFVAGFFKVGINTVPDALQALSRVRESKALHVYIERKNESTGRDKTDILNALVNKKEADNLGLDLAVCSIGDNGERIATIDSVYSRLFASVASAKDWAKFRYYEGFIKLATLEGYQCEFLEDKQASDALKQANELEQAEYKERLKNAPNIDHNSADKLRNKNRLKLSETDLLSRHDLQSFYGDTLGGLDQVIAFDKRGAMRKSIKRLEYSFLSADKLDSLEHKQSGKYTADKINYRLIREFNKKLLAAVGINENLSSDGAIYSKDSESIKAFVSYCTENKTALYEVANIPENLEINPLKFIGEQLRRLGIKQARTGRYSKGLYGIDADTLATVFHIVEYQAQTKKDNGNTPHLYKNNSVVCAKIEEINDA